MIQTTLMGTNELSAYTNINQYISISYLNENATNQYFGNFAESTGLTDDQALIEVLDVQSVNISQSEDGITSFVMRSDAPTRIAGSYRVPLMVDETFGYSLAFREFTEDIRFDVFQFDNIMILVKYQRYVPNTNQDTIPEVVQ